MRNPDDGNLFRHRAVKPVSEVLRRAGSIDVRPGSSAYLRRRRPGSGGGFTLIEVLAAMLLIGIVLPAVMQGVSAATRAGSAARHRTEAATLAEGKLSELMVTGAWDGKGLAGDFGNDWPGYKWRGAVDDWAGDVTGAGMQQLDVTVNWTEAGRPSSVTVTGLVYVRPVPAS